MRRAAAAALRRAGVLALCVAANAACGARVGPARVSVSAARRQPPGAVVTVAGTVTVPQGALASSIEGQGFAVQDDTGGIFVDTPAGAGVSLGDRVRVSGSVRDWHGFLMLSARPSAVRRDGETAAVVPRAVATGGVGEATEGLLVVVQGRVVRPVVPDPPYGHKVFVDDGSGEVQVFVATSTGIAVEAWPAGQVLVVTGLSAHYDSVYEVLPRLPADVRGAAP